MKFLQTPFGIASLTVLTMGIALFTTSLLYGAPGEKLLRALNQPVTLAPTQIRPTSALILTPTPTPTPTSIPSPTPTLTPTPRYQPAAVQTTLSGFSHMWQTWNNCGPATLAMNLSYFGSTLDQATIGNVLRRHPDDKNVSPQELAAFARGEGYQAQVRVNGNADLLRLLLSNGVPVLIETWLEPEPNDGFGHYRLLTGYDEQAQQWLAFDSYVATDLINPTGEYQGIRLPYAETDALWAIFNRTYLLVYANEQAPMVADILGSAFAPESMWQQALVEAQSVVTQQPDNAFAWFNLGTDWVAVGDDIKAAAAYDQARSMGLPWRMLWYQFGPFEAYAAVGRYRDVVTVADTTLATTSSIEELHYWRGVGLAGLGDAEGAREAWRQALVLNPDFGPAQEAFGN